MVAPECAAGTLRAPVDVCHRRVHSNGPTVADNFEDWLEKRAESPAENGRAKGVEKGATQRGEAKAGRSPARRTFLSRLVCIGLDRAEACRAEPKSERRRKSPPTRPRFFTRSA